MTDPKLRNFIGRMIAFYQADAGRLDSSNARRHRRGAQTIALVEVLRFLDGDHRTSDQLDDLVPFDLDDLPERLGGTLPNDHPDL